MFRYICSLSNPQINEILKRANNICSNVISFQNEWDMEPCSHSFSIDLNKWSYSPNKDSEWVYMLNRFEWLNTLLVAFEVTKEKRYLDKWNDIVFAWCENSRSYKSREAKFRVWRKLKSHISILSFQRYFSINRPLDVALRIIAFYDGAKYINSINNNLCWGGVDKEIVSEIIFLKSSWQDWYEYSNWGIIIVTSVLYISIQLNDNETSQWCVDKLLTMCKQQFFDDGCHIECTPMYSVQILISCLRVIGILHEKDIFEECRVLLISISKRITNFLEIIVKPDGKQPELGDSDNTSLKTIISISNNILYGYKLDENLNILTLFQFRELLKDYKICKQQKVCKSFLFPNAGIGVFRSVKGSYLLTTNGAYYSGHKHCDNGSFILYKKDKAVFIDTGRYSYRNCKARRFLRSENAHNTILVDGKGVCNPVGVWEIKKAPYFVENKIIDGNEFFTGIVCRYNGVINRKIVFIERYFLEIKDVTLIFTHVFFPGRHVIKENYFGAVDSSFYINNGGIDIRVDDQMFYLKKSKRLEPYIKTSCCSAHYNEMSTCPLLVLQGHFKNNYFSAICVTHNENINFEERMYNSNAGVYSFDLYGQYVFLEFNYNKLGIKSRSISSTQKQIYELTLTFIKNREEKKFILS